MSARAVGFRPLRSTRWCVLISGRGSNLAALLEKPDADVRLVLTTDLNAGGVAKARRAGIPVFEVSHEVQFEGAHHRGGGRHGARKIDWIALNEELVRHAIDAIFLLGFMRIVPAHFIAKWEGKILNLHPSLLPAFPGLQSIERAVEADAACGATIHEVVAQVDAGPLLAARVTRSFRGLPKNLQAVETAVHIDEQRLVKEIVEKWRPKA